MLLENVVNELTVPELFFSLLLGNTFNYIFQQEMSCLLYATACLRVFLRRHGKLNWSLLNYNTADSTNRHSSTWNMEHKAYGIWQHFFRWKSAIPFSSLSLPPPMRNVMLYALVKWHSHTKSDLHRYEPFCSNCSFVDNLGQVSSFKCPVQINFEFVSQSMLHSLDIDSTQRSTIMLIW